ncbi:MAG: hypothetical protein IKG56_03850 [Clostridia bacterium]|nr:hypothetical protein [Clostridia bacterium]
MNVKVNPVHMSMIEEELEEALMFIDLSDGAMVNREVLRLLDTAQKEGRLNPLERMQALDYLEEVWGIAG